MVSTVQAEFSGSNVYKFDHGTTAGKNNFINIKCLHNKYLYIINMYNITLYIICYIIYIL